MANHPQEITTAATSSARQSGKTHKKCVKCGEVKEHKAFPIHSKETGELGSYCRDCKNALAKDRRLLDAGARLRHYIVTRIKNELAEEEIPKDIHVNLEKYLGYRLFELKRYLREDIKEREGITLVESFKRGYHLDHKVPHKSFQITTVESKAFQDCWHFTNLWMIPAQTNLKKGSKTDFFEPDEEDDE